MEAYEVPLQQFLPAFSIRTVTDETIEFNNERLFSATWVVDDDVENTNIESIACADLVNSWTDMSEAER